MYENTSKLIPFGLVLIYIIVFPFLIGNTFFTISLPWSVLPVTGNAFLEINCLN